jgi:hypothetical protein
LDEIAKRQQNLRKTIQFNRQDQSDHVCLHDRLMSEIKQKRILKPIGKFLKKEKLSFFFLFLANQSLISSTSFESSRKRIRPVKVCFDSNGKFYRLVFL